MHTENELMRIVETYPKILVYGAKIRATVLISRIRIWLNRPHTDITVAITDTRGEIIHCCGHIVKSIAHYTDMSNECLVLIAASSEYQGEMEATARELGFTNILRINEDVQSEMGNRQMASDISWQLDRTAQMQKKQLFLQHQILNNNRLESLRGKLRRGGKIKVVFLLTSVAKFHFASIYRAMERKIDLFETAIWCIEEQYMDPGFITDMSDLATTRGYYEKLKKDGYKIIWGYDDAGYSKDLDDVSPDIVFYCSPYLNTQFAHQSLARITSNYLTCFIPYGALVQNYPEYHYENESIIPCWLFFLETRQNFDMCAKISSTYGINTVLSGHPMLDEYVNPLHHCRQLKLPKRPVVIYAPHWSVETWHNTATFHMHSATIMNLLSTNRDINFVFKPHPSLGPEIRKRDNRSDATSITYSEYLEYRKIWDESENGLVVEDSSFIDLFKQADCLITDSYTFITFWLPTGKPCMYLMNPAGPEDPYKYYYDYVGQVINSYYICKTVGEIQKTFKAVVLDGHDPKAEERRKQCDEVIYNLGHAGEFIAEYIERQLRR